LKPVTAHNSLVDIRRLAFWRMYFTARCMLFTLGIGGRPIVPFFRLGVGRLAIDDPSTVTLIIGNRLCLHGGFQRTDSHVH
jgi:hypothetical protein